MEVVATREADSGGTAYLVVFAKQGYIIEDGEAVRVDPNTALTFGEWPGDVQDLTFSQEDEFKALIAKLKQDELVKSGRKLSQRK
jgi:hypothetical protein